MKYLPFTFIFLVLISTSCSEKYDRVPEEQFLGTWELKGREIFDGLQITIVNDNGKMVGKLTRLNDNKYVLMFAKLNDVWISGINRSSNFQFKLVERKIGRDLFALYGLGTSTEFKVQFIDKNTIGLASGSSDPSVSSVVYKRVNE